MSWVTIHNKKDRFFPTMHQTLEKFYKHRSLDSLAGDHESKLTFGANSRNHVERKSLAGLLDHRGLPDGCQVVPAWKSERIPDSSAKKISAPSRLACARIFGYSLFTHCSTHEGFCSNALARGRWQLSPNCAKSRPTEAKLNLTWYFLQINVRIITLVHNANANFS